MRSWMRDNGKAVIVVPTEDPHGSEYVPAHWKTREWLTGFTGSAGTAVVTQQEAFLWTDSRYWLAAEEQLCGSGFSLKKDLVDESPDAWLKERGLAAQYLTETEIDALWPERPGFPLSQVEIVPTSLAGESAKDKIARLCGWMAQEDRSSCLVSSLAEIAWLLNLRGDDIPYTPVFISYLKVRAEGEHTLYIHCEQINAEVEAYLQDCIDMIRSRVYVSEERARDMKKRTDKYRTSYYKYYTRGQKWNSPLNYDLFLNTSRLSKEKCADIIAEAARIKFYLK